MQRRRRCQAEGDGNSNRHRVVVACVLIVGAMGTGLWFTQVSPRSPEDPGSNGTAAAGRVSTSNSQPPAGTRNAGTRNLVSQAGPDLPSMPHTTLSDRLRSELIDGLDPASVGWTSEVASDAVALQLSLIERYLTSSDVRDDALKAIFAADFHGDSLRPSQLRIVYDDGRTRVTRSRGQGDEQPTNRVDKGFAAVIDP